MLGDHGGGSQSRSGRGEGSRHWEGGGEGAEEHGGLLGSVSEPSGKTSPGLPLLVLKRAGQEHHPDLPALLPSPVVTMESSSA